ncbi:hypothetical protein EI555_016081, partial [Monodon monoceros]
PPPPPPPVSSGVPAASAARPGQTRPRRPRAPPAMQPQAPGRRHTPQRGYAVTRSPHLNKDLAFTLEERQQLNIHGLLPPCFISQDIQVLRVIKNFEHLNSDFDRGLFISIHDRGHIASVLNAWPEDVIKAIVVTDGERILGLGDLGCNGMGIPVGKLALYTACGGMNPQQCLPVMLDVGTENEMSSDVYGMNCLIQFEDFANINAFRLLKKYQNQYCTFNDDIQGIAHLIVMAMEKEGLPKEKAMKKIWLVDSKGLIVKGRAALTQEKEEFAHEHEEMKNLEAIVRDIKPTTLIEGTREIPTDSSVWRKLIHVIAQQVSDKHLEEGRLYPPLDTIRDVSLKIAEKIVKDAYQEKTATVYPEPQNKEAFVYSQMYSTDYEQILPDCYSWPEEAQKIQTKLD